MNRNRAVVAFLVAIIVILASLALAELTTRTTTATSSSQTSSVQSSLTTSTNSTPLQGYEVVKTNLTLSGQVAAIPCSGFNIEGCPAPSNATLQQVDLIWYEGNYYYVTNQTAPAYGGKYYAQLFVPFTVWFTNSTVYCISPAHPLTNTDHQNITCPTGPYRLTTITIPAASASSFNQTIGLRLTLNLSTTPDGKLFAVFDVFNTLDHPNNVSAAANWPGQPVDFVSRMGCGEPHAGYEIFRGNYARENFTVGDPLTLYAMASVNCAAFPPTLYFMFMPSSDRALAYSRDGPSNVTLGSSGFPELETWWGQWTGSTTQIGAGMVRGGNCPGSNSPFDCPLMFNRFEPGIYTVVASDEWGQVCLLHFTVKQG